MKTLFVDGYNLVHVRERLSGRAAADVEEAREGLIRELLPLAHPDYYQLLVVVFDAAATRRTESAIEDRRGIKVVFTRSGQSADSFIEAAVRRMVSRGRVEVATDDRLLASMAGGFGARVVDGASLLGMAHRALEETRQELRRASRGRRAPLEERVSEEVRRLLDEMRYQ
jgi:predicted RNA-binding protein with PIN domain